MNVQKQIDYWRSSGEEDLAAARSLLESGHPRHGLFFAHLAIEKMLKAHVAKATGEVPPRIHDLLRLADVAGVSLPHERRQFLARFQQYCLEGRYPDFQPTRPSQAEAESVLRDAQEVLLWLRNLLK